MKQKRFLLPLNIQYFAEEKPAEPTPTEPQPPNEPEVKYTQADIDRIVGERLAREKAKAEKAIADAKAEAERKQLEEQNEFKALYEAEKAAREQAERERQAERLQATKQSLLLNAGYTADKLPDLLDFVIGDDEEAVKASVEKLVKVAPPKAAPVDPAVSGGGGRQQPEQKTAVDYGRELFTKRIKK